MATEEHTAHPRPGLEPALGRAAALSAPFLVAGGISAVLVLFSARRLTTARIRAALAEAEGDRADRGA